MTFPYLRLRRSLALGLCPLVLLAGCSSTGAGPSARTPAKVTAPPIAANAATQPAPPDAAQAAAATAQAAADAKAAARAQQVRQLIANVETSYNSGVQNYRGNRLDAARLDFDFAVDALLTSGMDLKAEGPLADELDHLLNAINALEMDALKRGNGLSPRVEEAPLDVAEDLTFAPNPELVAELKTELNVTSDLPLIINDQVAGYINAFSRSESFRKHMAASLQRVGKYRGLIQSVLKEEGVPQDLIYLAVAESGFQPQALNARSGAGGMWQFMTYTGPQFGLTRNAYFDYRFDPEKSSRAYARYIKQLYDQFGDWYLAMASYNWGPGNIQRDVVRTGYADFWEFYRRGLMPAQTRAYVPQILAAILMAKNPERYGLDKLVPSPPVIYDTIHTDYSIDLRLVSDITGASLSELVELNPSMLRMATPPDLEFDLHIPPGTKDLYNERLKDIPEDRRASWRFHIVKQGETLDGIANALHAKVADIAKANGISPQDPMGVDDELVVPVQLASSVPSPQRYTLRAGDTLVTVADRFNVTIDELRKWNSVTSASVRPGKVLYVAPPVRLAPSVRTRGRTVTAHRSTSKTAAHTAGKPATKAAPHAAAKPAAKAGAKSTPAKSSTTKPKAAQ